MDYVPKDCQEELNNFEYRLKRLGNLRGCVPAAIGIWSQLQGKEPSEIPSSANIWKRGLVFDVERYAQAVLLIDNIYAHWGKGLEIKMIATRIAYGVGWDAAELCLLPKIGKARSKQLIFNNVKSLADFIKKEDLCRSILGKIYDSAKEKAESLLGEKR